MLCLEVLRFFISILLLNLFWTWLILLVFPSVKRAPILIGLPPPLCWGVRIIIGCCLSYFLLGIALRRLIFRFFKFLQSSNHKVSILLLFISFFFLNLSLNFKLFVKLSLSLCFLLLYFHFFSLLPHSSLFDLPLEFWSVGIFSLVFGLLGGWIIVVEQAFHISSMGFVLI